jgi:hypothetical protein
MGEGPWTLEDVELSCEWGIVYMYWEGGCVERRPGVLAREKDWEWDRLRFTPGGLPEDDGKGGSDIVSCPLASPSMKRDASTTSQRSS